METAGAADEVVKLLPALVVPDEAIDQTLRVLGDVAADIVGSFANHPDLDDPVTGSSTPEDLDGVKAGAR